MKLGVIGKGFVGNAVISGMNHAFEVFFYDRHIKPIDSSIFSVAELVDAVDGPIFVCVPTPMKEDGSCDTSIVESVIDEIDAVGKEQIVIIKSTIVPGTTERINNKSKHVKCVFNPEFLREANFLEDFAKQDRIIIGGPHDAVDVVKQMYQQAYPDVPTTKTSSTIAEMVKYVTNCFLATKVSFANEIYQICQKLGIDYDKVVEYSTKDKRLGTSHWAVPGPDSKCGFGLACFPKDLNALMCLAKELSIDPKVMNGVWEKNLEVRPEKDWEELKGRVVV